MATFGNTIIDYEELEKANLCHQVEAIKDLSRLAALVVLGQEHEMERGGQSGDEDLLHSLLWPLHGIAEEVLKKAEGIRASVETLGIPGGPPGPDLAPLAALVGARLVAAQAAPAAPVRALKPRERGAPKRRAA